MRSHDKGFGGGHCNRMSFENITEEYPISLKRQRVPSGLLEVSAFALWIHVFFPRQPLFKRAFV